MSNSLAIAAVTSSVRFVLDRAIAQPHAGPVGGARVTTVRPDALTSGDLADGAGLNVYCYLATPNHAWNLTDLPTRRSDGSMVSRPLAALDLHYLITCYGSDEALEPQRLLGRAVAALAATSVLGRDVVAEALAQYGADTDTAFLTQSDLGEEVELVKLTPLPLTLEEMSKLWGILDTPYQVSLSYLATVVLVSAEVTPTLARPVTTRSISVRTAGAPRLAEVTADPDTEPVVAGSTLVLRGSGLLGAPDVQAQLRIGPALLAPADGATPAELRVILTDDVPAGVTSAQVLHHSHAGVGDAPPARTLASSNALPVVVRPTVAVDSVTAADLTLTLAPPIRPRQRVSVLLSRLSAPIDGEPDDVTIVVTPIPPDGAATGTITLPHAEVPDGTWLVRVQVDGTESLPTASAEVFDTPALTLPPPP